MNHNRSTDLERSVKSLLPGKYVVLWKDVFDSLNLGYLASQTIAVVIVWNMKFNKQQTIHRINTIKDQILLMFLSLGLQRQSLYKYWIKSLLPACDWHSISYSQIREVLWSLGFRWQVHAEKYLRYIYMFRKIHFYLNNFWRSSFTHALTSYTLFPSTIFVEMSFILHAPIPVIFSLPLDVRNWLQLVTVTLPGSFYYVFFFMNRPR